MSIDTKIRTTINATEGVFDENITDLDSEVAALHVNKPTNLNAGLTANSGLFTSGLTGALNVLPSGAPSITSGIGGVTIATSSNGQITIGVVSSSNVNVSAANGNVTFGSISNYVVFLDATNGPFSVTLPNAATGGSGSFFHIKKIDTTNNAITISASNSQTIDGAGTQIISLPYTSLKITSYNNLWWLL